MTDERWTDADADGELLSAYLSGDLDDAAAAELEARLGAEPTLAARLDALAAGLVLLHGADAVAEPDGLAARLDRRLAQARDGAPVVSLDSARERRARSRTWWAGIGTAAAVVALGAVMASGALRGMGGSDADMAGDVAGETARLESSAEAPVAADEDASTLDDTVSGQAPAAAGGADTAAPAPPPRPDQPVVIDEQRLVRSEAQLRRGYFRAPEVQGLLGLPTAEAATLADAFTTTLQDAPPYRAGASPADCLPTITADAPRPLIPARVESIRYDGREALAYVLVTTTPEAEETDRVEIWVVAPGDCATLEFQQSRDRR